MTRWEPAQELSAQEQVIIKRLKRHRRLFAMLRRYRHELFDAAFQRELEAMYRDTGAGTAPLPPAFMCMVVLLQAYVQASDADAVELSVVDARWQMVLDCVGTQEPPFCQGALQQFRERLIANGMDQRLLEKTVELAKKTKEFGWRNLRGMLRIGVDARPLSGAGRVEDTFNLLGHAARRIAEGAAAVLNVTYEDVCKCAGIPVLLAPSLKTGLDIDWSDTDQKQEALVELDRQISSLTSWVQERVNGELRPYLQTLGKIQNQDVEEGPDGTPKLREGVAPDRLISIEDSEMRHGRKSKTKRFDGYKGV